jgi:DNA-directed RNA polymerase specialized sigma24 family protein
MRECNLRGFATSTGYSLAGNPAKRALRHLAQESASRRLQFERWRNVVEIHQANDNSLKEVAELVGISVAATKSRLPRARKILRKAFVAS